MTDLSEATQEEVQQLKIETMYTKQKQKPGQDFGDPKLIKYGKEIDVKTWIHENNVDCEIYETLEKYGTVKMAKADHEGIVGDMEKLDLRQALDRKIASENLWASLPLDVRKEFNHNVDEFMEKGLEWAKNKVKEANEKALADKTKTNTSGQNQTPPIPKEGE